MKKKLIGLMVVMAGLLYSCQPQSKSQETQGAEFDAYWNVGDSLSDMERLHQWEAYVEEHPQDEIGWRNLYHAKSMSTFFNREQDYQQMTQELMKRVKEAIPDTYTYYLLAKECSFEYKKGKEYAEEALKRLPEMLYEEDYKTWCRYFLREDKDEKRLKDMTKAVECTLSLKSNDKRMIMGTICARIGNDGRENGGYDTIPHSLFGLLPEQSDEVQAILESDLTAIQEPTDLHLVVMIGYGDLDFIKLLDLVVKPGTIVTSKGITTAISTIDAPNADAPFYDLQGRRVSHPRNGIYIHDGKKVVIR